VDVRVDVGSVTASSSRIEIFNVNVMEIDFLFEHLMINSEEANLVESARTNNRESHDYLTHLFGALTFEAFSHWNDEPGLKFSILSMEIEDKNFSSLINLLWKRACKRNCERKQMLVQITINITINLTCLDFDSILVCTFLRLAHVVDNA
jgi:hypothetical protein